MKNSQIAVGDRFKWTEPGGDNGEIWEIVDNYGAGVLIHKTSTSQNKIGAKHHYNWMNRAWEYLGNPYIKSEAFLDLYDRLL